jgi:NAD(P)-dependent dehydrogenase (short-subunit alcohol dehydrogenase family)
MTAISPFPIFTPSDSANPTSSFTTKYVPLWKYSQDLSPISKVHDTNVLGPIRVTTSFLPLLREGKDKKVIFISSGVASLTRTVKKSFGPMAPYAMSKVSSAEGW